MAMPLGYPEGPGAEVKIKQLIDEFFLACTMVLFSLNIELIAKLSKSGVFKLLDLVIFI